MKAEWISVEVREHGQRGCTVHRGLFPQSNVTTIQVASLAAILAQVMESVQLLAMGGAIEVEVSVSMPTTVELDEQETDLVNQTVKQRGDKRWRRQFLAANEYQEVPDGKGS